MSNSNSVLKELAQATVDVGEQSLLAEYYLLQGLGTGRTPQQELRYSHVSVWQNSIYRNQDEETPRPSKRAAKRKPRPCGMTWRMRADPTRGTERASGRPDTGASHR